MNKEQTIKIRKTIEEALIEVYRISVPTERQKEFFDLCEEKIKNLKLE